MVDERHNRRKWFLSSLTVLCVMASSSSGRAWSLWTSDVEALGGGQYMLTTRRPKHGLKTAAKFCVKQRRSMVVTGTQYVAKGLWTGYGYGARTTVVSDMIITFRCSK